MMKNKKTIVIFLKVIMMLIVVFGLTACQKVESGPDTGDGQTGEATKEAAVNIEQPKVEEQEDSSLLKSVTESSEYRACAEWVDFENGYDTDNEILLQTGNEPIADDYEYEAYNCYSSEMEDKIDEICEKYHLSKLSGFELIEDYDVLCSKTGLGDFCERTSENVNQTILSSYTYSDGTFLMEAYAALAGESIYEVNYQFAHVAKGSFTTAYLEFGDLSEYSMREYTTKRGEKVVFACVAREYTNAYIIAEREKSFVIVNVRGDLSDITDVNDERLELLADAFDFAAIP